MSIFVFREIFYSVQNGEGDVWEDGPTPNGTIVYSVITPIICVFGVIGNTLSLLVLCRRDLRGSIFTYLGVLAASDLCMSIAVLLSGLSRGFFWYQGWIEYDALVGLPLTGVINSLAVLATVAVTIDRVIFLWNPVKYKRPKWSTPAVARGVMFICFMVSLAFNVPFCFIFDRDPDGQLVTTEFFDSQFYLVFNWLYFVIFSIIPGVILMVGNGLLIKSLQKAKKMSKECRKKMKMKKKDHKSLTVTLISIIVMFLISEVPSALVSRTSAINLLYDGDHDLANTRTLEVIRQICTLLGAISLPINFVFYYLFCPAFTRSFQKMFRMKEERPKTLQVNVFVLDGKAFKDTNKHPMKGKVKDKILEISRKSVEKTLPGLFADRFCDDDGGSSSTNSISDEKCEYDNNYCTEEGEYIDFDGDAGYETNSCLPAYSTIFEETEISESSTSSTVQKNKY